MKNAQIIEVDGKFYQKAKVVMLPTEKASKVVKSKTDEKLIFTNNPISADDTFQPQYLCFLSEEEIKGGDYYFDKHLISPQKCQSIKEASELASTPFRKIIATTDESLKLDYYDSDSYGEPQKLSLPRPSNEFLSAFCKANGKIEEVLIEVVLGDCGDCDNGSITEGCCGKPIYKLKVAPDNTVTIKRVQEKMYSRDEVHKLMTQAWIHGEAKKDAHYTVREKWIEENL